MSKFSRSEPPACGKDPRPRGQRPDTPEEKAEETKTAQEALEALLSAGFKPERLDQLHDTLKLVGIVLGQLALLRVITNPFADEKAVVSAARALVATRESPDKIAERLRASSLSDLSVPELQAIIRQVETSKLHDLDLHSLIQVAKEQKDA